MKATVRHIKNWVLSNQPQRVIAKSVRNIFFPKRLNDFVVKTISIEVSSICDANCIFCNYKFGYRAKKTLTLDDFRSIAESCVALGYENLDFTSLAGELFTNKNAVEIIRCAKEAGFKHIGTYTNGILIHRQDVEALLRSGINVLMISTPGFTKELYEELFDVNKFGDFQKSVDILLQTHKRIDSKVQIVFEPRTYLTLEEMKENQFYKDHIAPYVNDRIWMNEPLRVFDTWGGDISKKDLVRNMKIDRNPMKSIYPLKKVYPCERLYTVGVHANGDVRLCNCRFDSSIETEKDSLYIASLNKYKNMQELIRENADKIETIRDDFTKGNLPGLCRKCPFYAPVLTPR